VGYLFALSRPVTCKREEKVILFTPTKLLFEKFEKKNEGKKERRKKGMNEGKK